MPDCRGPVRKAAGNGPKDFDNFVERDLLNSQQSVGNTDAAILPGGSQFRFSDDMISIGDEDDFSISGHPHILA